MDAKRGSIVVGAAVAVLVSAFAIRTFVGRRAVENARRSQEMTEQYDEYKSAEPKPKRKRTRANGRAAKAPSPR